MRLARSPQPGHCAQPTALGPHETGRRVRVVSKKVSRSLKRARSVRESGQLRTTLAAQPYLIIRYLRLTCLVINHNCTTRHDSHEPPLYPRPPTCRCRAGSDHRARPATRTASSPPCDARATRDVASPILCYTPNLHYSEPLHEHPGTTSSLVGDPSTRRLNLG